MLNDQTTATGDLVIELKDEFGQVKQRIETKNLVVKVGRNYIASRMTGTASAVMSHMGIGTSSVASDAAMTALQAAIGTRATSTATIGTSPNEHQITYAATFAPGNGTGAIAEAGIFNAATNGTMLCRTTFSVINKGANDTLSISWTVTIN